MERGSLSRAILVVVAILGTGTGVEAHSLLRVPLRRCAADAVPAGTVCLDKYEESVWRVPNSSTTNAMLVRRIQLGFATRTELLAAGATQVGMTIDDFAPCDDDGQNCANDIYAVSLPAAIPSAHITWFQAQEACANAGKRLPTNAEWQIGANGTPDAGPDNGSSDCNTANGGSLTLTGARSRCVSARGAFDMVGNLFEWVADWAPLSTTCTNWGTFSDDVMCLAGANTNSPGPGALLRGGSYLSGATAGPLTVIATVAPSRSEDLIGFRCAR